MVIKAHEVADIFPMSSDEEFESLKESIRKDGLLEDIWIYEGKIVDGRNRLKGCLQTGTTPRYREYKGEPDKLINFVLGLNLHRRHLTPSQKACSALEALGYYEGKSNG